MAFSRCRQKKKSMVPFGNVSLARAVLLPTLQQGEGRGVGVAEGGVGGEGGSRAMPRAGGGSGGSTLYACNAS